MKYLPPRCPDCRAPMLFVGADHDYEAQGGPPAFSWLCQELTCGRMIASYEPESEDSVLLHSGQDTYV